MRALSRRDKLVKVNRRIFTVVLSLALVPMIGGSLAGCYLFPEVPLPADPFDSQVVTPSAPAEKLASAGSFVEYSNSAIANAQGTILLFFHAPWCSQCLALESDILSKGVPDDVTIIKIDYDSHQDLRQQYGVTLQTTLVEVDAAGNEKQKFVAYETPTLQAVIDAML